MPKKRVADFNFFFSHFSSTRPSQTPNTPRRSRSRACALASSVNCFDFFGLLKNRQTRHQFLGVKWKCLRRLSKIMQNGNQLISHVSFMHANCELPVDCVMALSMAIIPQIIANGIRHNDVSTMYVWRAAFVVAADETFSWKTNNKSGCRERARARHQKTKHRICHVPP